MRRAVTNILKDLRRIIFPAFAAALFASAASAHGVGYRYPAARPVALEFYYSTGESMAYEETKVYSPADEKNSFQTGRTDEFGRFAFVPAVSGDWKIVVRDMEGHRAEASVAVTDEFLAGGNTDAPPAPSVPRGGDLAVRALLGVSVIINIAAFARGRA
jgi:nickel transport protein